MTDRTTLALAACEGLSNEELAERGPQGFARMIARKRVYARVARTLAAEAPTIIARLQKQLDQANATLAELQALDAPVVDTSEAAQMLAGIGKTGEA